MLFSFTAAACGSGGEAFAFLKAGSAARPAAMGGAYAAVADDAAGILYNPAGLVRLEALEIQADMYVMSFDRTLYFTAIAKPFTIGEAVYSTALSWHRYSPGKIERRSTSSPMPDSYIEEAASLVTATLGTALSESLYTGANIKFFFHNIGAFSGFGLGFDAGAMLKLNRGFYAAFCIRDIATDISWQSANYTERVPQQISAGLSNLFEGAFGFEGFSALLSGEIYYNSLGFFRFKAGAELSRDKTFFLRAGFDGVPAAGAGIRLKASNVFSFTIDYAFVPDTIITGHFNHRVSLKADYVFPHFGVESAEKEGVKMRPEPW